jgi:hypothetical protein
MMISMPQEEGHTASIKRDTTASWESIMSMAKTIQALKDASDTRKHVAAL